MPTVTIKYDTNQTSRDQILKLANASQKIVSEVTGIEDVFVYADSPEIIVKAAPIELYVEMSAHKVENLDELFGEIKSRLSKWKTDSKFSAPINLTITPVPWKFEVDI